MRDGALKEALKCESTCAKKLFTTLRSTMVKSIRKAKDNYFPDAKGDSRKIWNQLETLIGHDTKKKNMLKLRLMGKSQMTVNPCNHFFIESVSFSQSSL